jgi:HEPN domain-containing protein
MPHAPARIEETAAWLHKSEKDLWRAGMSLTLDPPDTEDCLFHCRQAAEKSLKAFLVWRDRQFRKTHDLEELAHLCSAMQTDLAEATRGLSPLTRFA